MNDTNDKTNMVLAIALSLAILLGWQYFMTKNPAAPQGQQQTEASVAAPGGTTPAASSSAPAVPGGAPVAAPAATAAQTREAVLAASPRLVIDTPSLHGSVALKGARLDDLTLVKYHETTDPQSPEIELLSPGTGNGDGAYYADFGWVAGSGAGVAMPGPDSLWTASGDKLSPGHPVTLTWDNGQGLKFTRTLSIDADYMFTVSQKVENATDKAVILYPYGLVARGGTPKTDGISILHEGPLGVIEGSLKEKKYSSLREDDHQFEEKGKGGWVGFTDKYWLTALVPEQTSDGTFRMNWRSQDNVDRFQTDWLGNGVTVPPGGTVGDTQRLFAGAKVLSLLDGYAQNYGIPLFDRSIDFGWFYFLTIPFFYFLRFLHEHVPNFGIAILIFTVVIKGAFFPIANKSYRSMSKMKKLQPEIKKLQERYADDRAKLNQEIMALYKREKASPVSGCLPILIQVPVFFALYKVLYVTIEMRQAPFFGWIHDLSVPDPTSFANLFGLIPWDPPSFLMIGVWPLIMGLTMWLQQKLNPAPTDPVQARIFMFLPIIFTIMLAKFPAGLVIYWAWSNILSIGQQWLIMRSDGKK